MKNVYQIVTPRNHVIAWAEFTLSWAPGTLGFLLYFFAKYVQVKTKTSLI